MRILSVRALGMRVLGRWILPWRVLPGWILPGETTRLLGVRSGSILRTGIHRARILGTRIFLGTAVMRGPIRWGSVLRTYLLRGTCLLGGVPVLRCSLGAR